LKTERTQNQLFFGAVEQMKRCLKNWKYSATKFYAQQPNFLTTVLRIMVIGH